MAASEYRTTDLVLAGNEPLDPVIRHLAKVRSIESCNSALRFVSDSGPDATPRFHVNVNACESEHDLAADRSHLRTPRVHIERLLDGVESLKGAAQSTWNNLIIREFNMGFDVGDESVNGFGGELPGETLRRIATANATLAWTIYSR